MATVRMTKDGRTADIYDSPETIKNARLDGWSLEEKAEKRTSSQTAGGNDDERKNASPHETMQNLKKKSVLQNG